MRKRPAAASGLNWKTVGSDHWPAYQASILATNATRTVTDVVTTPTGVYPGNSAYASGVLLPDGRVFCVPYNATSARIYDPATDTLSTPTGVYPGSSAYAGGVLLPDGRVFCVPRSATSARIYDPATDTLSTPTGTYPAGGYYGGVLLPDGRVFCAPRNATSARIYGGGGGYDENVVLSAYFNRF